MFRFHFGTYLFLFVSLIFGIVGSLPLFSNINQPEYQVYPKATISNSDSKSRFGNEMDDDFQHYQVRTSPNKRSTMLLNKLMHALHRALDNKSDEGGQVDKVVIDEPKVAITSGYPMERRGEDKMTRYFRCYFNAVSCF